VGGTTAWVLGDQLSRSNPALEGADRVLMVESLAVAGRLEYHRQKLHLLWTAMRRFRDELCRDGFEVDYRGAPSMAAGLRGHLSAHDPDRVLLLDPPRLGAGSRLTALDDRVRVVEGGLFLTSPEYFAQWASGRRQLRMEDFYRRQRRRFDLLMDGDQPEGGKWNFDAENRGRPPAGLEPPRPYRPRENEIDASVRRDLDRFTGEGARAGPIVVSGVDGPRLFPAGRAEARRALKSFCEKRLPEFGTYQDAMVGGRHFLWHALLSSSLNLGLLDPLECARAAEAEYRAGRAPLNSVEGFIRQVIGWREYVWGVYRLRGADLAGENALGAEGRLPAALDRLDPGLTDMACVADVLGGIRGTAYAHHIERLMVLGNLMLLAGTSPARSNEWFHRSFIDGYEWVMLPNVSGMALWADGGRMMSKPYAASGRYIDRMSDHCAGCRYRPTSRSGDDACPFTVLYWDFLNRNRQELAGNHRMRMVLANLDRITSDELSDIRKKASVIRAGLDGGRT